MGKLFFVMNPCAGTKKANRQLTDIISIFNQAGHEVTVHITSGQGDAARAVAKHAKQSDLLVCCGGDGTFNETISGMLSAGVNIPIGYLPAGSTNDFANSLRLPKNLLDAARNVVEGVPTPYDVGLFGDRYFSYVASFGAFTRASYATPQNVKNALGHTAYILGGISELSQIKDIEVSLELDGELVEGKYIFGAICNSTSVAGILTLDPTQVDMQDGKFEVMLVRSPRNPMEIPELINAIQKKNYNCRMMSFQSAGHIKVRMADPVDWTLDGERQEGLEQVEITNRHHAIYLLQREREK